MSYPRNVLKTMTFAGALAAAAFLAGPASADTAGGTLGVSMTVSKGCTVGTSTSVAFGSFNSFSSAHDATGALSVLCTSGTSYQVGLDAGGGTGATVTTRIMTGLTSTNTVPYALYTNAGRSTNWGNTADSDTLGGQSGNGAAQTITVYGRVASGVTPAPDTYSDTVNVTVTY